MIFSFISAIRKVSQTQSWLSSPSLGRILLASWSYGQMAQKPLFDATVVHGLSFANSFSSNLKGSSLVGGHTLVVGAQVRLHLLPHFLLGV